MKKKKTFLSYYQVGGTKWKPGMEYSGEPTMEWEDENTSPAPASTSTPATAPASTSNQEVSPTMDNASARDMWVFKTGLPWSEAKRLGYTDGSAKDNTKLLSELKNPKFNKDLLRKAPINSGKKVTPKVAATTPASAPAPEVKGPNLFKQNIYDSILAQGDNYTNSKRFEDLSTKKRNSVEETEYQNAIRAINDNELIKQYNNNPSKLDASQIDRAKTLIKRKRYIIDTDTASKKQTAAKPITSSTFLNFPKASPNGAFPNPYSPAQSAANAGKFTYQGGGLVMSDTLRQSLSNMLNSRK